MSTRALYTFTDGDCSYNVYKHHDGYVSGAARTLKMGLDWFAWQLPRFEADEFAAAFIAAGKFGSWLETKKDLDEWFEERGPKAKNRPWTGGGVRLMPQGNPTKIACKNCGDIAYRYEIKMATSLPHHIQSIANKIPVEPQLWITAFSGNWWEKAEEEQIFNGPFDEFYAWALAKDKEQAA